MKKEYDVPELELIKFSFIEGLLNASAEGDPGQIVDDGGGDPGTPLE